MKILVAEDEDFSRTLLERTLDSWGYDVVSVEDGHDALRCLLDPAGPRLAVLDWNLPTLDGLEICRRVRSTADLPLRYLLMLTARDRHEDVMQALDTGADAYMTKPWHLTHLQTRLNVGRRLVLVHQKLEASNLALARLSRSDPATGLLNRNTLQIRLSEELERGQRRQEPVGVFLGHINGLDDMQRVHGKAKRDELVQNLAKKLRGSFRSYDLMGLWDAQQICIAIPGEEEHVIGEGMLRFKNLMGQISKKYRSQGIELSCHVVGVFVAEGKTASAQVVFQQLGKQLQLCQDMNMHRALLRPFGEVYQARQKPG